MCTRTSHVVHTEPIQPSFDTSSSRFVYNDNYQITTALYNYLPNMTTSSGEGSGDTHHWHGILDSALDAVGHTPLIRLQRIAKEEGLKCNLCKLFAAWRTQTLMSVGKCEFFSAGGSIKDRIAKVRRCAIARELD